ncbi:MFS transporter [Amycolatopsis aidingensis]|uniref:MFS transporter n=1 Tax=Amycolatopsis aidingensis TaxID=2842453 RepID=UPI001E3D0B12|nr:MFS transporter [Amycolatopsis aidingensis]
MTTIEPTPLLRHRRYWRWSASAQLGRLPAAMAPLAFTVLTTATTGSYRLGGVLMAVFVAAELLGAVPAGRLLDRIGPGRGLVLLLCCAAAGFAGMAVAVANEAPAFLLAATVVLPGLLAGGLSGGLRTLLAGAVEDALLPRAIAVDAMLIEGVLVAAPLLVAALSLVHTLLPLLAMATAYLGCAALLPRSATPAPASAPGQRPRFPLRAALCWLGCLFTIGHLLSTIEVAPLALAQRLGGGTAQAAVLVAVLCGASVAGSGLFAWRGRVGRPAALACLGCFLAGAVPVGFDLGWTGLLAGVVLIGACTGPLLTIASVRLQGLLPPARRAEGFSFAFAVQATGFGLGSLSVGLLPLTLPPLLGAVSAALTCAMLASSRAGRPEPIGTLSASP